MRIPNELQIAGKTVRVIINEKYCEENEFYGECNYDKNIIYLWKRNKGARREKMEQVLIHEILHFCNAVLYRMDMDKEKYVAPLSELLYQVFKQIGKK